MFLKHWEFAKKYVIYLVDATGYVSMSVVAHLSTYFYCCVNKMSAFISSALVIYFILDPTLLYQNWKFMCIFLTNVCVNPFQFFLQFGPWVRRSSVKLMIRTLTVVCLKLGIIYSYTESTERSYIFMLSLKIIAQNKYLIAYNYNMMNYNCNKC